MEQFQELFDAKEAVSRISAEVDIIERQMCRPGMYPILQSSEPTTSRFVSIRPNLTLKPISPAAQSPAAGTSQQGSFNSLLGMVNSTQDGSPSSGSSIPCAQRSPANKQIHQQEHSKVCPLTHSLYKVSNYQISKILPVGRSLCLHKPTLNQRMLPHSNILHQHPSHFSRLLLHISSSSHCYSCQHQAHMLHISSKVSGNFYNLRLALKAKPMRQPRGPSPFRQGFYPSAQPFIPAAEAKQDPVPNTQEPRISKSADGQGVKNSSTMDKTCFRCKQPGHLKKNCSKYNSEVSSQEAGQPATKQKT